MSDKHGFTQCRLFGHTGRTWRCLSTAEAAPLLPLLAIHFGFTLVVAMAMALYAVPAPTGAIKGACLNTSAPMPASLSAAAAATPPIPAPTIAILALFPAIARLRPTGEGHGCGRQWYAITIENVVERAGDE